MKKDLSGSNECIGKEDKGTKFNLIKGLASPKYIVNSLMQSTQKFIGNFLFM